MKRKTVKGRLSQEQMHTIAQAALEAAEKITSSLRRDPVTGHPSHPSVHVVVLARPVNLAAPARLWPMHHMQTNPDAWHGSYDIARSKAYTALAFSSNENAMTTRSIQELSRPDKPLSGIEVSNLGTLGPPGSGVKRRGLGIITFPGGIPLYDPIKKELVGAIGVAGSTPDIDEGVAVAGARNWSPEELIKINDVTRNADMINYTKVPYMLSLETSRSKIDVSSFWNRFQQAATAYNTTLQTLPADKRKIKISALGLAREYLNIKPVGSAAAVHKNLVLCRMADTLVHHGLSRSNSLTFDAAGSLLCKEFGASWSTYHQSLKETSLSVESQTRAMLQSAKESISI